MVFTESSEVLYNKFYAIAVKHCRNQNALISKYLILQVLIYSITFIQDFTLRVLHRKREFSNE